MYDFVLNSRRGDEMHDFKTKAHCIESVVFTKEKQDAIGIDLGFEGAWVGFYVSDDELWAKVKDGTYPMFSIAGTATEVEA